MEVFVKYQGARYFFKVRRENPGIYFAELIYYEGNQISTLPREITLIRGLRQWTGSIDDKVLLNELGNVIISKLDKFPDPGSDTNNNRK